MPSFYENLRIRDRAGLFTLLIAPISASGVMYLADENGNPLPAGSEPLPVFQPISETTVAVSREPIDLDPAELEAAIEAVGRGVEARLMLACLTTPPDVEAMDWAALLNPEPAEPTRFESDDLIYSRRRFGVWYPPIDPIFYPSTV